MSDITILTINELYLQDSMCNSVIQSLADSVYDLSKRINSIEPNHELWGYRYQLVSRILEDKGLHYLFCLRHHMLMWLIDNHPLYRKNALE